MSRNITLSIPPGLSRRVIEEVQPICGVASISLQRGGSVNPPGDVLSISGTNEAALAVMQLLDEHRLLESGSLTLSEPTSIIAPSELDTIDQQGNEAAWEEMSERLRRDSNVTVNYLLLMACAGAVAAFGLVADTLHVVVGAMLIAPGFEPLLRIVFGLLGHRHSPGQGLRSALAGYLALAAAAAAAAPLAMLLQNRSGAELQDLQWVSYWSSFQWSGVAVSLVAGVAGAVIISARLSVFATGVMVALALVPSMAVVGLGVVAADADLALGGLLRWSVDVGCVLLAGAAVLGLKRRALHARRVFD